MNIVSAQDIKRRGMAAIEDALRQGPARILKYNRPAAVVLSEQDYQQLLSVQAPVSSYTVNEWMAQYSPIANGRSQADIDAALVVERASWGEG